MRNTQKTYRVRWQAIFRGAFVGLRALVKTWKSTTLDFPLGPPARNSPGALSSAPISNENTYSLKVDYFSLKSWAFHPHEQSQPQILFITTKFRESRTLTTPFCKKGKDVGQICREISSSLIHQRR